MSTVGHIKGDLTLKLSGATPLNLGTVSIPLVARTRTRRHSGEPDIIVEISADLEALRDTIQTLFSTEDGEDEQ